MSRFIRAQAGPRNTVIFTNEIGKQFIFSGGTRAWRNQNPGNLVPGKISKRNNQIGVAGGFAIFPDYETGRRALIDCLKSTYQNADIPKLVEKYAPKGENNVQVYTNFLQQKTGVKNNKKIKDFTDEEFEKLLKAIEDMEGPRAGTITEYFEKKEITQVQKNKKGTIISYFVSGMGWLSKTAAIKLARNGEINAVIATSRSGNLYLRTRPDIQVINNLENLG